MIPPRCNLVETSKSFPLPGLTSTRLPRSHARRKILWGSKIAQDPPSVAYEEVMAPDGNGLYRWLSQIVSPSFESPANHFL